ncbi:DNA-binding response regulator, LytR/AlgR family [Spirosomataceae bacterium TFI 002]|nr:DNA-binding response regulator, LytR/AlgR family [Spirosomataceae bacterium TFI 002]
MIKYLIVDDEPIAHDIIKGYCDELPHLKLMQHCYNALEALAYLRENSVDLIFLDLNMPKLKGFDFLKTLPNPPNVIVTTAYQEHALEGYELNVVDYLLKPFGFERFLKAINKVKVSQGTSSSKVKEERSIFLYCDKKHVKVKLGDIFYVEAAGNYCNVVQENENILIREKISEILDLLSSDIFVQVHKSYIVSKLHIDAIEGNRIMIKDHQIPIGKVYKNNLLNLLQ